MYFRYYRVQKTRLGKSLKILVSEELSTSNMFNGVKHSLNLHSRTFNIPADQYERNLVANVSLSDT